MLQFGRRTPAPPGQTNSHAWHPWPVPSAGTLLHGAGGSDAVTPERSRLSPRKGDAQRGGNVPSVPWSGRDQGWGQRTGTPTPEPCRDMDTLKQPQPCGHTRVPGPVPAASASAACQSVCLSVCDPLVPGLGKPPVCTPLPPRSPDVGPGLCGAQREGTRNLPREGETGVPGRGLQWGNPWEPGQGSGRVGEDVARALTLCLPAL